MTRTHSVITAAMICYSTLVFAGENVDFDAVNTIRDEMLPRKPMPQQPKE